MKHRRTMSLSFTLRMERVLSRATRAVISFADFVNHRSIRAVHTRDHFGVRGISVRSLCVIPSRLSV